MNNKKTNIKPFSMILMLAGIAVSAWFGYRLYTGGYISRQKYLYLVLGILSGLNLLCLLIAIISKRKWFQCLLSLLLILISGAGIYAAGRIDALLDYAEKVFTEVPETTSHSVYLLNHIYYMITDDVDNKEIAVGLLDEYRNSDIQPLVDGLATRNASLNVTEYSTMFSLLQMWNKHTPNGVDYEVMSTILPDELVELSGELFRTEAFLSSARVKYQYDEEISTQLNRNRKPDITREPYTVLIGGNDARGLKSDEDFMNRSDMNMLLTVNPASRKILLTILPYDLLVNLGSPDKPDRLTYASFYGITTWEQAAAELLNINIDYFARFNYSRIAALIDDYGGITVYNPEGFRTFRDIKAGDRYVNPAWYFEYGETELDGNKALVYTRELAHLDHGYEGRWENNLRVLGALGEKLLPDIKDISFEKKATLQETVDSIKESLRKCAVWVDKLDSFLATDIDTRELVIYAITEYLTAADWSFEIQRLTADYSMHSCTSANGDEMNVGIIAAEVLEPALDKINSVLGQ